MASNYAASPSGASRTVNSRNGSLVARRDPEVLSVYGNYVLNVLGDPELALRLWQEAQSLNPSEPQYRISVIKLLIAAGRYDEARLQITRLRSIGRFGQFAGVADDLQNRLHAVSSARRPVALPAR